MNQSLESKTGWMSKLLRFFLPLLVLGAGIWISRAYLRNPPRARREPAPRQARLVEVAKVELADRPLVLRAMGEVQPAREVNLAAQVSGVVMWLSPDFVPGRHLKPDTELVRLDERDYQSVLRARRADLEQALGEAALEKGRAAVSEMEMAWYEGEIPEMERDLLRRGPQSRAAAARVDAARAAVERAELDVARTRIRVPFPAVVNRRDTEQGALLSPGNPVGGLVGSEHAWVVALLPTDQIPWLSGNARVRLFPELGNPERLREGRVLEVLPTLETRGRMARVLVEVPDPLGLDSDVPPLRFGSFVEMELEGLAMQGVVELSRRFLRNEDQVYVMDSQDRLDIREVDILYRGEDSVWIRGGLLGGERLVVSDLPLAVAGMALRLPAGAETAEARPSE